MIPKGLLFIIAVLAGVFCVEAYRVITKKGSLEGDAATYGVACSNVTTRQRVLWELDRIIAAGELVDDVRSAWADPAKWLRFATPSTTTSFVIGKDEQTKPYRSHTIGWSDLDKFLRKNVATTVWRPGYRTFLSHVAQQLLRAEDKVSKGFDVDASSMRLFMPSKAVRRYSEADFEVFLDPGDLAAHQAELGKVIEDLWSTPSHHLHVVWTSGDRAFKLRLLKKGHRNYVDRRLNTVNFLNGVAPRHIAHEIGHVLGFEDHYQWGWDRRNCGVRQRKDFDEIMSDAGRIGPEHWAVIQNSYPILKEPVDLTYDIDGLAPNRKIASSEKNEFSGRWYVAGEGGIWALEVQQDGLKLSGVAHRIDFDEESHSYQEMMGVISGKLAATAPDIALLVNWKGASPAFKSYLTGRRYGARFAARSTDYRDGEHREWPLVFVNDAEMKKLAKLPAGSFSETCVGCTYQNEVMECNCRKSDGSLRHAALDFKSCTEVKNKNGQLVCEKASSSSPDRGLCTAPPLPHTR